MNSRLTHQRRSIFLKDSMIDIPHHSYADIFPTMPVDEMQEFVNDIKKHGLRTPIVLYEGKILDGRHRYEACQILDIEPRMKEYDGDDPLGFVISVNTMRRHLTASQRGMVAAKIADLKKGQYSKNPLSVNRRTTHEKAAKTLNVSQVTVDRASAVLNKSPALAKEVENGKITLHAATKKLAEIAKPKVADDEPVHRLDKIGRKIPDEVIPDWDKAEETGKAIQSQLQSVINEVNRALEDRNKLFFEIHNPAVVDLKAVRYSLKQIIPHAVCPSCNGLGRDQCRSCGKRGFISQFRYDHTVLPEVKQMLEKG